MNMDEEIGGRLGASFVQAALMEEYRNNQQEAVSDAFQAWARALEQTAQELAELRRQNRAIAEAVELILRCL